MPPCTARKVKIEPGGLPNARPMSLIDSPAFHRAPQVGAVAQRQAPTTLGFLLLLLHFITSDDVNNYPVLHSSVSRPDISLEALSVTS
jgi:hypothetical protein